jgi:membrane protein implicated in regulation of membrane protease activity
LKVVKVAAGIAALVFWFVPLATWTKIVLFIVSIAVFAICTVVLKNLDDTDDGKNADYWPNKPNDCL